MPAKTITKAKEKKLKQLVAKPDQEEMIGGPMVADVEDAREVQPPTDAELGKVRDLANFQIELVGRITKVEDELAALNEQLKRVSETDLPEAMARIGMKEFVLTNSASIKLAEALHVSIKKENEPKAFEFLEQTGNSGMIKRRIQILFGKDQLAWANKFLADCRKRKQPLDLETKIWIEPPTLKAFANRKMNEATQENKNLAELLPPDIFSVFKRTYAKITEAAGK